MAYATEADLATYVGASVALPATSEQDRLLRNASAQIDAAIIGSFYATDTSGNPTDVNMIAALNTATCAQVEYWLQTGDELGLSEQFEIIKIGSVLLNKQSRGPGTKPRRPVLCPKAIDALRSGGLLPTQPVVW